MITSAVLAQEEAAAATADLPVFAAALVVSLAIAAGAVFLHRNPKRKSDESAQQDSGVFVRSLLALWLVVALILFTLLSFYSTATSPAADTLIGALTASAGAAVAYYFSSKAADDARRDILGAIPGLTTVDVPDFKGKPVKEANAFFLGRGDVGVITSPKGAKPENIVTGQNRTGRVATGTVITIIAGPPQCTGVTAEQRQGATVLHVTWDSLKGAVAYTAALATAKDGEFSIDPQTTSNVEVDLTPGVAGDYWVRVDSADDKGNVTPGEPAGPFAFA